MATSTRKLYFAYGSNMDIKRIENRVGKVTKVKIHYLRGFKLSFNVGKGFANVVMTGDRRDAVPGVVYELTSRQMRILDSYEGFPLCYQKIVQPYNRKALYIYASINPLYVTNGRPTHSYLQHLVNGYLQNELTTDLLIQQIQRYYNETFIEKT